MYRFINSFSFKPSFYFIEELFLISYFTTEKIIALNNNKCEYCEL